MKEMVTLNRKEERGLVVLDPATKERSVKIKDYRLKAHFIPPL